VLSSSVKARVRTTPKDAAAVRTPGLLPNATLVLDPFHLVALANDAVTTVRRRVTWELKDRRAAKIDPEWANRRRLLTGQQRLSERRFAKMWKALYDEDPNAQILSAYTAKEELRDVLSTVRCGGDPHRSAHRLHRGSPWFRVSGDVVLAGHAASRAVA